jgi:hypothetical protein
MEKAAFEAIISPVVNVWLSFMNMRKPVRCAGFYKR